ncbi:hypothetical protein WOLCODRAFT_135637 [Wolfiporia cocos MD-104 SS10]|uniref:UNC-45/Cro1/She4 central domain-containing protein n=1 Tax=Wolfiporia cocos (strain MD-104) TaxID=742152 RepID=A0A2H3IWI9_WOLCO|nr:hypothetical protein WOLCODRAFT_135637 [Wolfiporia cocos MD-104 SS10]
MAHLLAQASGHKSCRALISSQHTQWLTKLSRRTDDNSLRAAAAVALVKLSRGAGADAAEVVGNQTQAPTTTADDDLVRMMTRLVVSGDDTSLADAIEGLAYMSTDPHVKEMLVDDSPFLKRLFSVIPRRKGSAALLLEDTTKSPVYGVSVIIHNLCSYRPRLTEEQAQVAKLRRMAKAPSSSGTPQELEADPLDDDEHVKARGRKLVSCGVLDALTAAVRATDSRAVRLAVGKALLGLIEDKDNRGKVLQAGGAKALTLIIIGVLPSTKSSQSLQSLQLDASDIEPMQALAKLAITASPLQVFGPNEGALYDAVRPFALMLVHPSANLLQRFEALMALTNLASSGGAVASRVAQADGLLNKVEMLMLEEHVLVRRAATELICNLVGGCEDVWTRYGGTKAPGAKSRLQVLAALCDVEDVPTRMAAAGALAVVSASPDACELLLELQRERHRVLPILGQLIDPGVVSPPPAGDDVEPDDDEERESPVSPGLVHRGVVCILNLFMVVREPAKRTELATEADRIGIVRALVGVVKSSPSNSPALRPAAEAIKWLLGSGIEVTI